MRKVSWITFKQVASTVGRTVRFVDSDAKIEAFVASSVGTVFCSLPKGGDDHSEFESDYEPDAEETSSSEDADVLCTIDAGEIKPRIRDSRGMPLVALDKPSGMMVTYISPRWNDKTTWYSMAERHVDVEPTPDGSFTVYSLPNGNIIDSYHGKISDEDYLLDAEGHSFRVIVKVNGVTKSERDPHVGSGGDYTIDYAEGKITFLSPLAAQDEVLVTYHKATTSDWIILPPTKNELGQNQEYELQLLKAESQFGVDVVLTDSTSFQIEALGTPVGKPKRFKSMADYLNDSTDLFPECPPLGGDNWRSMPVATRIYQWKYSTTRTISQGMGIRIKLDHNVPLGGSFASSTLYCRADEV